MTLARRISPGARRISPGARRISPGARRRKLRRGTGADPARIVDEPDGKQYLGAADRPVAGTGEWR